MPSVEGQHAFAGIAVEFNVDARKGNGSAHYVRLRLEREAAKSAARRSVLARPAQRIAQGNGIGRKRALHLERGAMADVAVEREFKRRPGETEFDAGSLAQQRGGEVGQADGGVDRLVMPREAAGGGEASGDRWPGEGHFYIRDRLQDLVGLIAQDDGAVGDPDLRERCWPVRAGFEIARQRLDVVGPV